MMDASIFDELDEVDYLIIVAILQRKKDVKM